MVEIDTEAVRAAIESEIGSDEVWELVKTFRTYGRGGEVIVKVWHHPEYGFQVSGRDEDGNKSNSNPETDAVLAVQVGHLGRFRARE